MIEQILNRHTGKVIFEADLPEEFDLLASSFRRCLAVKRAVTDGIKLIYADLCGASLHYADMSRIDLTGAKLSRANLSCADLTGSILRGADLSGVDLSYADLRDADLRGAALSGAVLYCADLTGADLTDAIFPDKYRATARQEA